MSFIQFICNIYFDYYNLYIIYEKLQFIFNQIHLTVLVNIYDMNC